MVKKTFKKLFGKDNGLPTEVNELKTLSESFFDEVTNLKELKEKFTDIRTHITQNLNGEREEKASLYDTFYQSYATKVESLHKVAEGPAKEALLKEVAKIREKLKHAEKNATRKAEIEATAKARESALRAKQAQKPVPGAIKEKVRDGAVQAPKSTDNKTAVKKFPLLQGVVPSKLEPIGDVWTKIVKMIQKKESGSELEAYWSSALKGLPLKAEIPADLVVEVLHQIMDAIMERSQQIEATVNLEPMQTAEVQQLIKKRELERRQQDPNKEFKNFWQKLNNEQRAIIKKLVIETSKIADQDASLYQVTAAIIDVDPQEVYPMTQGGETYNQMLGLLLSNSESRKNAAKLFQK